MSHDSDDDDGDDGDDKDEDDDGDDVQFGIADQCDEVNIDDGQMYGNANDDNDGRFR